MKKTTLITLTAALIMSTTSAFALGLSTGGSSTTGVSVGGINAGVNTSVNARANGVPSTASTATNTDVYLYGDEPQKKNEKENFLDQSLSLQSQNQAADDSFSGSSYVRSEQARQQNEAMHESMQPYPTTDASASAREELMRSEMKKRDDAAKAKANVTGSFAGGFSR